MLRRRRALPRPRLGVAGQPGDGIDDGAGHQADNVGHDAEIDAQLLAQERYEEKQRDEDEQHTGDLASLPRGEMGSGGAFVPRGGA